VILALMAITGYVISSQDVKAVRREAKNRLGEEFGMERFLEAVALGRGGSADRMEADVLGRLQELVGDAVQYDDITLLALKWQGKPADIEGNLATETANVA
jgi:NAD/NADP transhydrogenase alpha subunit